MGCQSVKVPGGDVFICRLGRRYRCVACTMVGGLQCDWKVSPTKTCDAYICPEHAFQVAPNKHLCPQHQEAYKGWQARRAAKDGA